MDFLLKLLVKGAGTRGGGATAKMRGLLRVC